MSGNESVDYFQLLESKLGDNFELKLVSSTNTRIEMTATQNKVQIGIFYDRMKNVFGFNMLQGGCKTYPSIDQFVTMFTVYAHIHTDFIPAAKKVADMFEQEAKISTVYKTFKGNMEVGFIAVFQVLGEEKTLVVAEGKEYFVARLLDGAADKDSKVLRQYSYKVMGDGSFRLALTEESFSTRFTEECFNSSAVEGYIQVSSDTFSITCDSGLAFTVKFDVLDNEEVCFKATNINGVVVDNDFVLEDCFDVRAMITRIEDMKSDLEIPIEESESEIAEGLQTKPSYMETAEEVIKAVIEAEEAAEEATGGQVEEGSIEETAEEEARPTEEIVETKEVETESSEALEETTEEPIKEVIETEEESIKDEEPVNEEVQPVEEEEEMVNGDAKEVVETTEEIVEAIEESIEEAQETESSIETSEGCVENSTEEQEISDTAKNDGEVASFESNAVSVRCTEDENGAVVGVTFISTRSLFTCSLEALKPYHLPINRISARDKVSKKSGMSVLDSEIKFKTFAIDISDDAEMIESLIQRMF